MKGKPENELENEFFKLDAIRARHLARMNRIMSTLQQKSEDPKLAHGVLPASDHDLTHRQQWHRDMVSQVSLLRREILHLSHRIDMIEKSLGQEP